MKHEAIGVFTHQSIDALLVARCAKRGNHQPLGFTAREECRAVRTRQYAGANGDRAHGARVATVDTRFAIKDLATHDFRLKCKADFLYCIAVGPTLFTDTDFIKYTRPDGVNRMRARLLFLDLKRRLQVRLGNRCNA